MLLCSSEAGSLVRFQALKMATVPHTNVIQGASP